MPDRHAALSAFALALVLLLPIAAAPRPASAAEAYDNCTGFVDVLPAVLTTQGTWCLRRDLATAMTSGSAITIAASNVTLDCNGFKLGGLAAGTTSTARGINAENRLNVTVRDCAIRGFYRGVNIDGGGGHLVEDNRFDYNLYVAIRMSGENNIVRRNRVYETGGYAFPESSHNIFGIWASADVLDNVVDGLVPSNPWTFAFAIRVNGESPIIRGNVVRRGESGSIGYAVGIAGDTGGRGRIENNHVAGTGGGWGIERGFLCIGNSVTGTSIPFAECEHTAGNFGFDEVE